MEFEFDLQMFADVEVPDLPEIGTDYQLLWDEESWGLIEVKASSSTTEGVTTWDAGKFTIAGQPTKTTLARPTTGTKYYLAVKNAYTEEGGNNLQIGGIVAVDATASTPQWVYPDYVSDGEEDPTYTINDKVVAKGVATVTAPSTALTFDAAAATGMTITINNLAKDSAITLKAGDQATTGKLDAGDTIKTGSGNDVVTYTSAGGALTLVGKTTTTTTDDEPVTTHSAILSAGDVKVATDSTLTLAGDSAKNEDDITVTVDAIDTDGIVVKAKAGKVTGITGLNTKDATVEVKETSIKTMKWEGQELTATTVTTYTFKALNADGTMIERTKAVSVNGGDPTETKDYLDINKGGDIYTGRYTAAQYKGEIGEWGKKSSNAVYYYLADSLSTEAATNTNLVSESNATTTTAGLATEGSDKGKFRGIAGGYYLKVSSSYKAGKDATATTPATPSTTTIGNFEVYKANAAGALTKVTDSYTGTLTYVASGIVNYTKPAKAEFYVNITNADIRSKFTNLTLGSGKDSVTTKAGIYENLAGGTYNFYSDTAIASTFTTTGTMNVTVDSSGAISAITGFDASDSVTYVSTGKKYVYKSTGVISEKDSDNVTHKYDTFSVTITDLATGACSTYTKVKVDAGTLKTTELLTIPLPTAPTTESIATDFDWTTNKSKVGYFKGTTIPAKGGAITINPATSDKTPIVNYLKVELGANDAVTISAVKMQGTDVISGGSDLTGTFTINAPAKTIKLAARPTGIADTATINITGLAAGSEVYALGEKDKVTTASLQDTDKVVVGTETYYAGGDKATLTINNKGLYNGSIWALGTTDYKVGRYTVTNKLATGDADAIAADSTALTGKSFTLKVTNGSSFTLGELDDGDKFTIVDNKGTEATTDDVTFTDCTKYGNNIYATVTVGDETKMRMYSIGSAKTISSSNFTTSSWKEALAVATQEEKGTTVVNLTDKVVTSAGEYTYVRDAYVTSAIKKNQVFNATAVDAATATAGADYLTAQGAATVTADAQGKFASGAYVATASTAQTINAANKWTVTASAGAATIINGAASGEDKLIGNTGADKFTLKGADDIVDVGTNFGGKDEITGYTSGKDKLIVAADSQYYLSKTNGSDVYVLGTGNSLPSDPTDPDYAADLAAYNVEAESGYVLLKGVSGKAISISTDGTNYATHYFGNGKVDTKGKTAAGTFTYEEDAFYHGNDSGANTLKVNTIKGKATRTYMGDAVQVDLDALDGDTNGPAIYTGINIVDATASANEVELTASASGSTLKGGTYKSKLTSREGNDTLWGGSGDDTFVLGDLETVGKDTVKNYTTGKDTLSIEGDVTADLFSASGKNVLIGYDSTSTTENPDNNYVTVENAVSKALDVKGTKVFVGEEGKANTFTSDGSEGSIYVGSESTTVKDTIKLVKSVEEITVTEDADENDPDIVVYKASKYQSGTFDLAATTNNPYKSIEVIDASGVKATSTAIAEFGTKFVKAHAGVNVTAATAGTEFTGSDYNDKFTCGDGADIIHYTSGKGDDIIDSFGKNTTNIDDVIQFNGLTANQIADVKDKLTAAAVENGTGVATVTIGTGSLKFTGISAGTTFEVSGNSIKAHMPTA